MTLIIILNIILLNEVVRLTINIIRPLSFPFSPRPASAAASTWPSLRQGGGGGSRTSISLSLSLYIYIYIYYVGDGII